MIDPHLACSVGKIRIAQNRKVIKSDSRLLVRLVQKLLDPLRLLRRGSVNKVMGRQDVARTRVVDDMSALVRALLAGTVSRSYPHGLISLVRKIVDRPGRTDPCLIESQFQLQANALVDRRMRRKICVINVLQGAMVINVLVPANVDGG
jgi:hypothetical protein